MKKQFITNIITVVVLVIITQLIVGPALAALSIFAYVWIVGMLILGFVKVADGVSYLLTYPFKEK